MTLHRVKWLFRRRGRGSTRPGIAGYKSRSIRIHLEGETVFGMLHPERHLHDPVPDVPSDFLRSARKAGTTWMFLFDKWTSLN